MNFKKEERVEVLGKVKKMKKVNILLCLMICLMATSQLHAQYKLEVTITNLQEVKGTVRMALYGGEKNFLKSPIDKKEVKVSGNSVTVVFENLKLDDYGISVFHDVDDNKKLDKGFMGVPNEPYGFSNNARGQFGPPAFEKAKISVSANTKASIKVE